MKVVLIGAELEENLAVRYLWGALDEAGHEVEVIVFNDVADLEREAERLAGSDAPLAGMSLVFTRRAAEFARLATRARELGYRGHITVGGHFAAFNAEALLHDVPAIDSVVIGEGERILCDLAAHLDEPETVAGVVVRTADGGVVRTEAAQKPRKLDELAWPARKVPYDDYLGLPIVNLLGSRGCSHECSFCSIAAWHRLCGGARLRLREPEAIAEEMGVLYADGVRVFNFHDDNFIIANRPFMLDRLDRLERALCEHRVGRIAFAIKARPDEIDRPLLTRLLDMGLFRLFLGIEAGTADALVALGRGQRLDDNERALALVNDLGIHACFNLLMFHPDSTLEDVSLNVEFLRTHPDNPMNFCRTEIYSGTPLERSLRASGRLLGDHWGHDYRIADPRAERAFQIAFSAFEERNFGPTSLHHMAMRLDYEHHLLAHFFGSDERLEARVSAMVETINLDTAEHLRRIVDGLAAGVDLERLRDAVVGAVARSDEALGRLARALLLDLHAARVSPSSAKGTWAQRATTAGLVAALTVTTACGDDNEQTHPTEMAPIPTEPVGDPMQPLQPREPTVEPVPAPEHAEPTIPAGEPAAIRRQFDRRALRMIARSVTPARDTLVELTLDADGRVTEAEVTASGLGSRAHDRIVDRLLRLAFTGDEVVGRRFAIELSRSDLERAVPVYTHHSEMAAPPYFSEMAPSPYVLLPRKRGKRGD